MCADRSLKGYCVVIYAGDIRLDFLSTHDPKEGTTPCFHQTYSDTCARRSTKKKNRKDGKPHQRPQKKSNYQRYSGETRRKLSSSSINLLHTSWLTTMSQD